MSSRRRRLIGRVLPALVALGAIGVVGVLIATDNERQKDDIAAATLAGQDYLAAATAFETSMKKSIKKLGTDDPAALRKALVKKLRKAPELADVSKYGREHSASYRTALTTAESLTDPYRRLNQVLKSAAASKVFVDAATKALDLRISDYVPTTVSSSSLVRSALIPAFVAGLAEFEQAPVPEGQEEVADQVADALQYVISQSNALANSIDARRNFSFSYDDEFNAAITAVTDYATVVDGDVAEAVAAVTTR